MSDNTPTTVTPPLASPAPNSPQGPYGNPNQHVPEPKYNLFSLISFISAFFMSVLAVVMGHMALSEIRKTGERGRGLALAGLILGYLGTLAGLGFIILMIVAAMASPTSEFSVFDSKAQSGITPPQPQSQETAETEQLLPSEETVSAHFCNVLASLNANTGESTDTAQTPDELLNSYRRLGEVPSPNQQVYAEFYAFVSDPQGAAPDPAETQAITDKVQVASVSDAHACAALGGGN